MQGVTVVCSQLTSGGDLNEVLLTGRHTRPYWWSRSAEVHSDDVMMQLAELHHPLLSVACLKSAYGGGGGGGGVLQAEWPQPLPACVLFLQHSNPAVLFGCVNQQAGRALLVCLFVCGLQHTIAQQAAVLTTPHRLANLSKPAKQGSCELFTCWQH